MIENRVYLLEPTMDDAPRRSSWRSLRGLRYDGELAMSSGVSFMVARLDFDEFDEYLSRLP